MTLFALPFFGVGVWMLWSISSTLYDGWQMRDWSPVEARLLSAGYETNSGGDSDTYEAYASYTYAYRGQEYSGNRVSISRGGDNIGDFQRDLGRRLSSTQARGEPIVIYVDPEHPSQSIVDRSLRWGLIGFKSIFLFVFGGFGLGLLVFVWRAPQEKDPSKPEYQEAPWLINDKWQTPTIRSSSKSTMYSAWAFAAFWNLISAPLPFLLYEEVFEKQNYIALIGLLFPLVGIGLITWAMRRTLEWTRFGAAPVTLDPFPGSIGGHVGGTIDLNLPFDRAVAFQMTLTSINSYVSGSGDSRSRKEEALWQDALVAHAAPTGKGTRLTFRFEVPEGLQISDASPEGDSHNLWRLNLTAELPGADLDRDFEIPVYATAAQSRHLSDRAVAAARQQQITIDDQAVRDVIKFRYDAGGKIMVYPMGRHIGPAIGGLLVGGIFAAVGWFLIVTEGRSVFGAVFAGAGALIAVFCLYLVLNSLEVSKERGHIKTVRRLMGIPISRKHMHRDSIVALEKNSSFQTQSGGKHVMHYSIHALDNQGNTMTVGEGFKGDSETRAAMRIISHEFGLTTSEDRKPTSTASESKNFNLLASDN